MLSRGVSLSSRRWTANKVERMVDTWGVWVRIDVLIGQRAKLYLTRGLKRRKSHDLGL